MRCDYFVKVRVRHFGSDFRWSDENEPRITRSFSSGIRYTESAVIYAREHVFGGHEAKLHLSGWKKRTIIELILPLDIMNAEVGSSRNS